MPSERGVNGHIFHVFHVPVFLRDAEVLPFQSLHFLHLYLPSLPPVVQLISFQKTYRMSDLLRLKNLFDGKERGYASYHIPCHPELAPKNDGGLPVKSWLPYQVKNNILWFGDSDLHSAVHELNQ